MVVFSQDVVHFNYLCLKVFVEHLTHLELEICPLLVNLEQGIFVNMQRIKHAQPGLSEAFIKSLEVRLDHDEVERALKFVPVERLVQHADLWSQIFANILQESDELMFEHVSQIRLVRIFIGVLGRPGVKLIRD